MWGMASVYGVNKPNHSDSPPQQCRQFHIGIADAIRKAAMQRKSDVPVTKSRQECHVSHLKAARQAGYVPGQPPATPAEITQKMNTNEQV